MKKTALPKTDRTYSTGQVAHFCRCSIQTIIRVIDSGQLPGFKVPGSNFRRVTHGELTKYMMDNGIPLPVEWDLSAAPVAPERRTAAMADGYHPYGLPPVQAARAPWDGGETD